MVPGSLGSQKSRGAWGKPSVNRKSRPWLFAHCCYKSLSAAWSTDFSPCRDYAKSGRLGTPLHQGGTGWILTAGVRKVWRLKTGSHAWDKKLGHKLVNTEFRQKPARQEWLIDCFSLRTYWRVGVQTYSSRDRDCVATIFITSNGAEILQGAKLHHVVESGATHTEPAPSKGGAIPPGQGYLRINTTGPTPRKPAGITGKHQIYWS